MGSPAHAGMDPEVVVRQFRALRLPRPRGDGPLAAWPPKRAPTAPPPTRGWTLHLLRISGEVPGSPAHAGMDRLEAQVAALSKRLPRPRGDGPMGFVVFKGTTAAPPPTRGWTFAR